MRTSATQYETFGLCPRKWYGQKVIKLPEIPRGHFEYGEVQHEVAERFLGSTLAGRVPDEPTGALSSQEPGEPTNLYPDGWQKSLSYGEAQHIADTTQLAIEEGVLVRKPDSEVERWFELPLVDDITVVGAIDYSYPWVIEDHKTTKSVKYAATDANISSKLPMKLYAWALTKLRPGEIPDKIGVRHNIFRKDKVAVHVAENEIPTEDIYKFVDDLIMPRSLEMKAVREAAPAFLDAPGPTTKRACQEYGGCPFQKICGKQLTVEQYERQVSALTPKTVEGPRGIFGALPKKDMGSLEERLAKFKAAAETKKAPAPATTDSEEVLEEYEEEHPAPPWAFAGCTACSGIGWNSKKNPCKICQNMTKIKADEMTITKFSDELVSWENDTSSGVCTGPHGGLPAAPAPAPTPTVSSAPEPASEAPSKAPEAPAPTAPAPEPVSIVGMSKKSRGRPKKTFTLALNCMPVRGTTKVQHLDVLFKGLIDQFNEDNETPYYLTNAFERRDIFASAAEAIADDLGTDILFACPDSPDARALVDALRPYASVVWAPMGQTVTVIGE